MLEIKVPAEIKILVIGDIHEHPIQFEELLRTYNPGPTRWVVSAGDVFDKGAGLEAAEDITRQLQDMQGRGFGYAVRGNHELSHIKKSRKAGLSPVLTWWDKQPLAIIFTFPNQTKLTVVHAGIPGNFSWRDLDNVTVAYTRKLDKYGSFIPLIWKKRPGEKDQLEDKVPGGKSWHLTYDGRLGYIAAGHDPQKDGVSRCYNYSCNLDTAVYHTGILTGRVFSENGLEDLIQINGKPAKNAV